jgi:hypothetical protein
VSLDQAADCLPITDVGLHQGGTFRDRSTVALGQIIQHHHMVGVFDQLLNDDTADVAGAARD